VCCLVRTSSDVRFLRDLGLSLCEGALDDPDSLPSALQGVEAVIHCAGAIKAKNIDGFMRVNRDGPDHLVRAAVRHAPKLRRFVHVSTAGVMGAGRPGHRHRVDDPPAPATHYGESKLAGERALLAHKSEIPIVILRPPAIYGPRDREILAFFKMVKTGVAFRMGKSLQSVSMIYGPDCAEACIRAIDADVPSGSVFFVDDGETYSFEQMATAIAEAYGVKIRAMPSVPSPVLHVAAMFSEAFGKVTDRAVIFNRNKLNELLMTDFVTDGAPAMKALDWKPEVQFPEGAKKTAAWYREHGWA
jgi:2-alkyl-3-oxoalkanoate reductase